MEGAWHPPADATGRLACAVRDELVIRWRAALVMVSVLASVSGLTSVVGESVAAPSDRRSSASGSPSVWSTTCSADKLGLGDDEVGLAPKLTSNPDSVDGRPVAIRPDTRGRYVPIILVHGWTAVSTHDNGRTGAFSHLLDLYPTPPGIAELPLSFVGQVQHIPGAAVFTFDYHPYSARWVDDDHLGPGLGKVIDCLYRASGERVIVAGHSMGGLVARFAASHDDRASKISRVITFGTPETGSDAAAAIAGRIAGGSRTSHAVAVLRLLLSACGGLTSDQIDTGTLCDTLPTFVAAFDSAAGRALRTGSPEVQRLRAWPRGLEVDALAGATQFQVPAGGWFDLPWDTTAVDAGDLIVGHNSALAGATRTASADCRYQLSPVRGAVDQAGLALRLMGRSDVAQFPLGALSGACFHTSLMRDIVLTNKAATWIRRDIAARSPITSAQLRNAPVPSLCGHRPGRLTDGKLRSLPEREGYVELAGGGYRSTRNMITTGDLDGDGNPDTAAVFACNAGGVAHPDWIVFYTAGPTVLGAFETGKVVGDARNGVQRISYRDGRVDVASLDARSSDAGCCASGRATYTLSWNGRRIVASTVRHLVGPTDITFTGIGAVRLGMSRAALERLGYVGSPLTSGCVQFVRDGQPSAILDPGRNRVVRVDPGSAERFQTAIGGIKADFSLLSFVLDDFAGYARTTYYNRDFGQGAYGLVVHGPGGNIGFSLEERPDADGLTTITGIHVGDGDFATALELTCG